MTHTQVNMTVRCFYYASDGFLDYNPNFYKRSDRCG